MNRYVLALLAIALIGPSCKRKVSPTTGPLATAAPVESTLVEAGPRVPSGDVRGAFLRFPLAIYWTPSGAKVDVDGIVQRLTKDKGVVVRTEVPKAPTNDLFLVVQHPSIAEWAPPSATNLRYSARGLTETDIAKLVGAKEVMTLVFAGPSARAADTLRLAVDVGAAIATATNGFILDDATRESFTAASWRATLDDWDGATPHVARTIVVHTYKDGDLLRLVTLGMEKLGLPDISVNQVSAHEASSMGTLINLACQTLFERSVIDNPGTLSLSTDAIRNTKARAVYSAGAKAGSTAKVDVAIADAVPREGDAQNRLLEIVFPGALGKLQERQNATLTKLFGSSDSMLLAKSDDAELLAASARAKIDVRKLKSRFANGSPDMEHLLVKAPFKTTDDSVEWMWVEVVRWDGATIHGVLESDPYDVPSLKAGARVDVSEDSIFDYIYRGADGGSSGNETGRILEAQSKTR